MDDWLELEEFIFCGSRQTAPLLLRVDQVVAVGRRNDGVTWVRTGGDMHCVTARVEDIREKLTAPEWERAKGD